jgi:fervidolysin-like protein
MGGGVHGCCRLVRRTRHSEFAVHTRGAPWAIARGCCDTAVMRVVVGIASDAKPESVEESLRREGARSVQGPAPSLPDVLVAEFPDADAGAMVKRVAALPGVRYAEPDEMRTILD